MTKPLAHDDIALTLKTVTQPSLAHDDIASAFLKTVTKPLSLMMTLPEFF